MQTDIIVLPIDPFGPLRVCTTGSSPAPALRASAVHFSPHSTLSLYQSLDAKSISELLKVRLPEPFVINAIQVYHTRDPQPSRKLLELALAGGSKED